MLLLLFFFFLNVYQFLGTTSNLRGWDVELYLKHSASLGEEKKNSKAEKEGCFFVMSFFRGEDREKGKKEKCCCQEELGGSFFTDPISKFFF